MLNTQSFLVRNAFKSARFHSTVSNLTIDKLSEIFKQYDQPNHIEKLIEINPLIAKIKRASLLIPIHLKEEYDTNENKTFKSYFTLSKRTEKMKYYSNQICFIGGKKDESDADDLATVLREAHEEAGIDESHLKLLARLTPFVGTNLGSEMFLITPFIFYFDKLNYKENLNRDEVAYLIEMPTEKFLSNTNHESSLISVFDQDYYLHYFNSNCSDRILFGVTAFACILASTALHQRKPEFDVDPMLELTPQNLNQFIEDYVLKKSLVGAINRFK